MMDIQVECRYCGSEVHSATLAHVREQLRLIEQAMLAEQANTYTIQVSLVVKGFDRQEAYSAVAQRLNAWFLESRDPPFEPGSLLHWSSREEGQS